MLPRLKSSFEILPAIDIRGGQVVRLRQGDFAREQAYSDDPVATARAFREAGARWLHVVDLDGARTGEPRLGDTLAAIVERVASSDGDPVATRVQVGGGLRDAASVATVLDAGAARAVIGTAALENPGIVSELIARHGADRIAVALDIREGYAVGQGWVPGTPGTRVEDVLAQLNAAGVATFVVTAIERDGLLGGPSLDLLRGVVEATNGDVIASGGIASVSDLAAVREIGCRGAIVGRAIYESAIDLREAIAAFEAPNPTGRPADPSTSR